MEFEGIHILHIFIFASKRFSGIRFPIKKIIYNNNSSKEMNLGFFCHLTSLPDIIRLKHLTIQLPDDSHLPNKKARKNGIKIILLRRSHVYS